MSKISNSISITKSSFGVLRKDKELISINFFGGLSVVGIWIIGMLLIYLAGGFEFVTETFVSGEQTDLVISPLGWAGIIGLSLVTTFMRFFVEAMIAAAALFRFRGGDPTVASAFAAAKGKSWPILQYSMVSVTIGLILRAIEEKFGFVGTIVANLLNVAWAIASAFAIINIVDAPENLGPIKATKRSGGVIKKTWGENVVLNLGLGLAMLLGFIAYTIPGALLTVAAASASGTLAVIVGSLLLAGLLILLIAASVLSAIVKAAIYFYAVEGVTPEGFDQNLIASTIKTKKKGLLRRS